MGVLVEQLIESHAPAWESMRLRLGPEWFCDDFTPIVREYFDHGTIQGMPHVVLIARDRESREIVGFAEISLRQYAQGCASSPVGYLEGWFVKEPARLRGVGRSLVEAGENWGRSHGCTEFASDAEIDNETSRRAHRALGFEDIGTVRCFRKTI